MFNKNLFKDFTPWALPAAVGLIIVAFALTLCPHIAWADIAGLPTGDDGGGGGGPAAEAPVAAGVSTTGGGTTTTATTLGAVFCNVFVNAWPFGAFCEWTAYIAGAALTIQGIYHFRGHTENPQNFPLNRAIMLWFGAMCLLALPSVINTIIVSLYGAATEGGGSRCATPGIPTDGSVTPDVILTNLVTNIQRPLTSLISLIAIICGLFMIVRGLMKASKYGFDPRAHSVHAILANIVFGAVLLTIGDNLKLMMKSVFGKAEPTSSQSVLSWNFLSGIGASSQFENAVIAALGFVQLIGAIAFVRGWLIMKKVVEGGGQATMAQGITHILGGVFAINIYGVLKILDNTFGTQML